MSIHTFSILYIIYIYVHYITLHYITLLYITLHCIALHCIALLYFTLHYITLHFFALRYVTLSTVPYVLTNVRRYLHTYAQNYALCMMCSFIINHIIYTIPYIYIEYIVKIVCVLYICIYVYICVCLSGSAWHGARTAATHHKNAYWILPKLRMQVKKWMWKRYAFLSSVFFDSVYI